MERRQHRHMHGARVQPYSREAKSQASGQSPLGPVPAAGASGARPYFFPMPTPPASGGNTARPVVVRRGAAPAGKDECDPEELAPGQVAPQETDARRLEQRQKQLDMGKSTVEYAAYLEAVPRHLRQRDLRYETHPLTPDKHVACSKRSWDGQVRKWRRLLHFYDPPMEGVPAVSTQQPLPAPAPVSAKGEPAALLQLPVPAAPQSAAPASALPASIPGAVAPVPLPELKSESFGALRHVLSNAAGRSWADITEEEEEQQSQRGEARDSHRSRPALLPSPPPAVSPTVMSRCPLCDTEVAHPAAATVKLQLQCPTCEQSFSVPASPPPSSSSPSNAAPVLHASHTGHGVSQTNGSPVHAAASPPPAAENSAPATDAEEVDYAEEDDDEDEEMRAAALAAAQEIM